MTTSDSRAARVSQSFFLESLFVFVSLCRPVAELVQDISEESWLKFGAGKLSELCKLLPEESEVNPLLHFFSLTPNSFTLVSLPSVIKHWNVPLCRLNSCCPSVGTCLCCPRPTSSWCSWSEWQGEPPHCHSLPCMLRHQWKWVGLLLLGDISSYEEHLKMMVLKEEFFPLMEEVKNSISLMIKGASGNVFQKCSQSLMCWF